MLDYETTKRSERNSHGRVETSQTADFKTMVADLLSASGCCWVRTLSPTDNVHLVGIGDNSKGDKAEAQGNIDGAFHIGLV
jgi:hypothetical protein